MPFKHFGPSNSERGCPLAESPSRFPEFGTKGGTGGVVGGGTRWYQLLQPCLPHVQQKLGVLARGGGVGASWKRE